MIGVDIKVERLAKTGLPENFLVNVEVTGSNSQQFVLSISRTVFLIWKEDLQHAAEELAHTLVSVRGASSLPPNEGFWFDSYNSGSTLIDTLNVIRNYGGESFIKNHTPREGMGAYLGDQALAGIDKLNEIFINKFGKPLFRPLNVAFEFSRGQKDLNEPPSSYSDFIFRICILSVIIDFLNICLPNERHPNKTLKSFQNWLKESLGDKFDPGFMTCFFMIKNLRKQYPIHNQYKISATGELTERDEILKAQAYFNIRSRDFAEDWVSVLKMFIESVENLLQICEEVDPAVPISSNTDLIK